MLYVIVLIMLFQYAYLEIKNIISLWSQFAHFFKSLPHVNKYEASKLSKDSEIGCICPVVETSET